MKRFLPNFDPENYLLYECEVACRMVLLTHSTNLLFKNTSYKLFKQKIAPFANYKIMQIYRQPQVTT